MPLTDAVFFMCGNVQSDDTFVTILVGSMYAQRFVSNCGVQSIAFGNITYCASGTASATHRRSSHSTCLNPNRITIPIPTSLMRSIGARR